MNFQGIYNKCSYIAVRTKTGARRALVPFLTFQETQKNACVDKKQGKILVFGASYVFLNTTAYILPRVPYPYFIYTPIKFAF